MCAIVGTSTEYQKTQNMINTDHSMVVYLLIIFLFALSLRPYIPLLSVCQNVNPPVPNY